MGSNFGRIVGKTFWFGWPPGNVSGAPKFGAMSVTMSIFHYKHMIQFLRILASLAPRASR